MTASPVLRDSSVSNWKVMPAAAIVAIAFAASADEAAASAVAAAYADVVSA